MPKKEYKDTPKKEKFLPDAKGKGKKEEEDVKLKEESDAYWDDAGDKKGKKKDQRKQEEDSKQAEVLRRKAELRYFMWYNIYINRQLSYFLLLKGS